MFKIIRHKKGQIGETITWVVATIIIILILGISIAITSTSLGGFKLVQENSFQTKDVLASKSFFSHLSTMDPEGKTVYSQLKEEENLNEFNGELGKKIFEIYGEEYEDVWIGITIDRLLLPDLSNDYFGGRPGESAGGLGARVLIPHVTELIYLDENKFVELALKVIY